MKTLMAILLSFIMAEAPVLARYTYGISGSGTSLVGTYAGVLVPTVDTVLTKNATDFGTNSLGLFTLGIPESGVGAGSAVIFSNGRTFTGAIQALRNPDPSSGGIIGILTATFNYNLSITLNGTAGETESTIAVTANAQGSFDATAVQDSASVGGLGLDLSGTSQINVDQGFVSGTNGTPIVTEQITFAIEGYKDSNTPPTASTASTTTTGG